MDYPTFAAKSFRDRVLALVKKAYPHVSFRTSADSPLIIIADDSQEIGLQNLSLKFMQSDQSDLSLEQLVKEHFDFVLLSDQILPEFDVAKSKLKPQIMPPEYAEKSPIVSFPFGNTLAVGIAVDVERGYSYLKIDEAISWNKSHQELLNIAISNLDEASRQIQMQSANSDEAKWIGVETKDGFDAARILIPNLRKFFADKLGSPFRFGIPNRDFLICWNTGASPRFAEFVSKKLQTDFDTQPYPLSSKIFEVNATGTITE